MLNLTETTLWDGDKSSQSLQNAMLPAPRASVYSTKVASLPLKEVLPLCGVQQHSNPSTTVCPLSYS